MEILNTYTRAGIQADKIEAELRRLGRWQDTPLPEGQYENMGAFGSNTMSFEQWIQFILVINIRAIITDNGDFPDESQVGTYAVRAFDADPEAGQLTQLLIELDDLIEGRDKPGSVE